MLWIMIKNNLKLMLRSKLMLVIFLAAPIIVMAALSNAFDGLLQSDYEFENIKIGYCAQENSPLDMFLNDGREALSQEKISLVKQDLDNGKNLVEGGELEAFIYEEDEKVKIYSVNPNSVPTEMCQFIVNDFYTECGNLQSVAQIKVEKDKIESLKLSTAGNYYGIIEVIYFLWYGMIYLTAVVQSERKNRISQRFVAAPTKPFTIFLSKYLPCLVVTIGSAVVSMVASYFLFDVNWGYLPETMGIIILTAMAAVAVGITCLYLVKNLAVSVILLFSATWAWGFLGGTFETYMFSGVPEKLKLFSPIYYVNRTLVELSTMGHSDYLGRCAIVMIGIFLAFSVIGSLLMKCRMEDE